MYLRKLSELSEITVEQLSTFLRHSFSISNVSDFVLLDINDTAEIIAYDEESKEVSDYYTNVNINGSFKCDGDTVNVKATLKGVFVSNGEFTVDVVKSVKVPLDRINERMYEPWLGSAMCSAYLLCRARSLRFVNLRLICVHPESLDKRKILIRYSIDELEKLFSSALFEWSKWTRLYTSHTKNREAGLKNRKFPY